MTTTLPPEAMDILGAAFFGAYFLFCIGILIFVLMLLSRFVKAHEQISRHMYEMACDFKTVAEKFADREKQD